MKVAASAQKTKMCVCVGGGDSCGPLKAEAGARCLDGGAVQQWQPSEAPSTPFDQLTGA